MRYVTSIEQLAKQEGIEQGVIQMGRDNVIDILETRFEQVPDSILSVVNGIEDTSVLKMLLKRAIAIPSTAQFQQVLDDLTTTSESV
ncbi:hypothetical protein VB620_06080 [Nodularia harveyana UHCC-0300]|uniref:Uncharacterized protein n=1 Tax=Nodularia harveyana UHCC-0300 TaxID=2974287 RepID=A0ABU5UEM5_9CYAN|nr:hypothetical protein [Nodularia harveyana]MEA5580906.1 hypothetical protein [Nodularia harveyana UHCC-0300]